MPTVLLEKEVKKLEGADSEEEIKKRLRGLGYISTVQDKK